MKLTPFGKTVRMGRIEYGSSLKAMADALKISSPMLSSIELGERKLTEEYLQKTIKFFQTLAVTQEFLDSLENAGNQSLTIVETSMLKPEDRGLVAAFARKLFEDGTPPPEFSDWLTKKDRGE